MSSPQSHNIVIVGGNFGGVNLAHYLLRKTFVSLQKLQPQTSFRVTLISPNTHFYFKIAAPRALLDPTSIPEEKYFKSIAEAFKQYDVSKFNHIQGKATGLDAQARTVSVDLTSDSKQEVVKYDSLVIATGTSSSPLWTILDDHETTRTALKGLHEALPKASTVLIAGAGPVGVETAGEVASKYPNAKVTLITPSDRILPREAADLSAKATSALKDLGVIVKTKTSLSDLAATEGTRPVKLSDGSSENPDVFINATGAHKMNTEWLPSDWLDDHKAVLTRDAYFRVKSKGSADDVKNVYTIGDVVSGAKRTAIELDAMVVTVASSIALDLAGSSAAPAGSSDGGLLGFLNPFNKSGDLKQVEFKPMNAIVIPIGPNGGVGKAFGWNMPSFMVKKGKSEKFLLELVDPLITGTKWA